MSNQDLISIETLEKKADILVESGLFPDVKSKAQAMIKIWAGRELGLSDFQAIQGFYMVKQGLAMTANLMAALIKKNDKYDYEVSKHDVEECSITFFAVSNGERKELGTSSFTFKDAAKAGLVNKDNWKNYPKNMLFARALSNGARWYCPDAIGGFYTKEEMEDVPEKSWEKKTKIIDAVPYDPMEDFITSEQAQALVTMIEGLGYSVAELETFVTKNIKIAGVLQLKNKDLLKIKEQFKKKEK